MSTVIPHDNICDLAKLTMLVYDYGKKFRIDNKTTIEEFVNKLSNENEKNENEKKNSDVLDIDCINIIEDLAKSSPYGKVHKFFNNKNTD